MATLPWTTAGSHEGEVVVLASRLQLRTLRDVPGFLRAAMAIRRQVLRSPGAVGVSLIAQPGRKTFWTLSAWIDEEAISRFVAEQPHRTTMTKYHDRLIDAGFTTWRTAATSLPRARTNAHDLWDEGRRRLAVARAREPEHG